MLFIVAGITLAVGLYVLTQINSTAGWTATSTSGLAISNATSAIGQLVSWFPIIALVLAAAVVIYLIVGAFSPGKAAGV